MITILCAALIAGVLVGLAIVGIAAAIIGIAAFITGICE